MSQKVDLITNSGWSAEYTEVLQKLVIVAIDFYHNGGSDGKSSLRPNSDLLGGPYAPPPHSRPFYLILLRLNQVSWN